MSTNKLAWLFAAGTVRFVCVGGVDAMLPVELVLGAADCVLHGPIPRRVWFDSWSVMVVNSCGENSTFVLACFDDSKLRGGVVGSMSCAADAAAVVGYCAREALCRGALLGSLLFEAFDSSLSNVSGNAAASLIATHSNRLGGVVGLLEEVKAAFDRSGPKAGIAWALGGLWKSQVMLGGSAAFRILRIPSMWVLSVVAITDVSCEEVAKELPRVQRTVTNPSAVADAPPSP